MKRYKKLLIALAAIASIYIVRATGLDKGLIDDALDAVVDTVVVDPEPEPELATPPPAPPAQTPEEWRLEQEKDQ